MKTNSKRIFKLLLGMTLVSLISCSSSGAASSESFSNSSESSFLSNESTSKESSSRNESSTNKSSNSSQKPSSSQVNSSSSKVSSSSTFQESNVLECGHNNEVATVTPPTCKTQGYTMHLCLTCGSHIKDDAISPLSCSYDYEYVTTSSSGYSTTNSIRRLCSMCGTTQAGDAITKLNNKVALDNETNFISNYNIGYVAKISNEQMKAYPSLGYEFVKWSNGDTNPVADSSKTDLVAIFKLKKTDLPIISIDIANNVKLSSIERINYENATYTIIDSTTEVLSGKFKGRGNGSWFGATNKSGYSIKFDSKTRLLGMPSKSKKWNIIACKDDGSMHINQSAYSLARNVFDGIEWQPDTKYANVYINKEYRGTYMVTESISIEGDRISAKLENTNGDYDYSSEKLAFLVEYDRYATKDGQAQSNYVLKNEPKEDYTYFKIDDLYRPFTVSYPDPDDIQMYGGTLSNEAHNARVLQIKEYVSRMSTALKNKDYKALAEVVDINSMVDMYLDHELYKNSDVGWSSFYIYKKPNEDKMRFGPAWDFDLSATKARDNATSGKHISIRTLSGSPTNSVTANYNDMFVMAVKTIDDAGNRAFKDLLIERYKSHFSGLLRDICKNTYGNNYDSLGFAMNSKRWSSNSRASDTNALYKWLLDRGEWMYNNDFVG